MRNQSYNNFWQRIHQSAKTKAFPLRVMFELTYRCNFRCRHCYVPQSYRKKAELKTKEIFSILDQLAEMGCFYLGFTGGEPFIRKDIIDILWYAKKKGFEIIIYSNGSLINEELANELQRLRPNKVDITILGMTKATFERISGVPDSRDKVFRAIEFLYKKGVNLGFKSCVLKDNESEIGQIQDFTKSLGALHRLDDTLSRRLDGSEEPFKYRGLLNANKRELNANSRECLKKNISVDSPKISDNSPLFRCGVGESQAAITPLGELKMCLMIDYPKYKILNKHVVTRRTSHQQKSLEEAWEKLKRLVVSITPDRNYKCDMCELESYCKWCPGKGWLYQKSFTPLERRGFLTGFTSCEPESRLAAENYQKEIGNIAG